RGNKFFQDRLVCYLVLLQLVFDILLNPLFVLAYCIYKNTLMSRNACFHTFMTGEALTSSMINFLVDWTHCIESLSITCFYRKEISGQYHQHPGLCRGGCETTFLLQDCLLQA